LTANPLIVSQRERPATEVFETQHGERFERSATHGSNRPIVPKTASTWPTDRHVTGYCGSLGPRASFLRT
jgi:hypothetical protein